MRMNKMSVGLLLGVLIFALHSQPATAAPASADEVRQFRELATRLWAAWDKKLSPADAAPFYSQDPQNLYFDFTPMKFTGWEEYARVAGQSLAAMAGGHAVTRINDDFTVIKGGKDVFIVAYTFHVDFYGANGQRFGMDPRETEVWQKEGGQWRVVHQHTSLASGGGQQPAAPKPAAP